jgi:N-acetylglucosamine-6-sulfatase
VRRTTRWTALLGFGLLLILPLTLLTSANRAPASTRPNIVFVLTDDQGMDTVKDMPYLSGKPGGSWVEFTNAYVNVPFCCPSRAGILTGQYAHHHGVNGSNGGSLDDASTIATWLSDAGYRTGIVGKYLNGYPFTDRPANYVAPGWDYWAVFDRPPDHYDYSLNENRTSVTYARAPEDYSTDVLYGKAIDFLETTPTSEPFLLYFSTRAPHEVNKPAPRHEGDYRDLPIRYRPNFNEADVSDKPAWVRGLPIRPTALVTNLRRRAAETMLAVDEAISGIVDKVRERGQLENTVIVFMTDNGVSLGSHRWMQKRCAYEECVRTPLLIRYPGIEGNRREDALVSSVDIAPTFAELAGATPGGPVDGRSLVPLLNAEENAWRTSVLMQYQGPRSEGDSPTFWAVRAGGWKYVELATGETELYDLENDPYELVNVVTEPENAERVASLAVELDRLRSD